MKTGKTPPILDETRREAIRCVAKARGWVIAVEEDGSEWMRIEDVCRLAIESEYNDRYVKRIVGEAKS